MRITVVCFGSLKDHLPTGADQGRVAVDVGVDATVADVVALLSIPDRLLYSALVDGERVELDHGLTEGAEVTLMPPFAGGSN